MKTVPTLCATASVVGASAVGLSFGREPPLNPQDKRKPSPARELDHRPMLAATHTTATTTTTTTATATTSAAHHYSAPIPRAPSYHLPFAARRSQDGRSQRRIRRMTSADPALQRPHSAIMTGSNGYAPDNEQDVDELDPAAFASSRRPSWMKRLSSISTSQPSSRNTSPGPLSPSVSCSNGSMAFSHDGSTAPMIGERPAAPLPPNKLVKRSSSVHVPREPSVQGAASRLPSFRRPATSHQRSATLVHQTALLEMTAENPSADEQPLSPSIDSDSEYTQYFTAKVTTEKTLSKRKSLSVNAKALRRITPHETHKPTLLLARSVTAGAGAEEAEDSASDDGESLFFVSRPGTPMSITAIMATQADTSTDNNRNRPSVDNADDATRPRRSFSITDFLSSGSSAKKQRTAKLPGAKLARRSSQRRVTSAPLPTMAKRQSVTAHGESTAASTRRDFSDPALGRRAISTSAGLAESEKRRYIPSEGPLSSPWLAVPHRASATVERTPASTHQSSVKPTASTSANRTPPSPTSVQTGGRPSRHSMAPSEQASTLVGSDNEARGVGTGDEDDLDLQSETVFDSLRTGATRSTSGARGPRIETIFDESPPSKVRVTALRDLLPKGTFREQTADAAPGQQSIAEEDESISTPVRTIVPDRSIHDSPSFSRGLSAPNFPNLIPSSPPDMPQQLSLGTLEWDARAGDDDSSSRWSVGEEEDEDSWGEFPSRLPGTNLATPISSERYNPRFLASDASPKPATPQHLTLDTGDKDARSSIFDWSEQQPTDKSPGNHTPPRPSTVHGKKDADRRGSRSVGRRAPSGLHARSQSVPVVPDAAGKRSTVVTNKFGTWGVGSKGVTEDWNDDFEFSELNEDPNAEGAAESQRVDSGVAMIVPKTIQQQQSNVLANIGLLREWGLLIEELKEHRIRAASLGILQGTNGGMWEEVDAMIDLADQEAEHDGVPGLSPPSSPAFDEDAFDDLFGSSPNLSRQPRKARIASEEYIKMNNGTRPIPHSTPQSGRSKRKSILPSKHQVFGPQSSPVPLSSKYEPPATPASSKPVTTRPRKDSEAKARSVIEALQKRRSTHEPLADTQPPSPTKKVPFDTATLRRIVPYVNTLTRRVKDSLREAEGLYSSPDTSPAMETEPPFSKIFQPDNDISTQMKVMTVM